MKILIFNAICVGAFGLLSSQNVQAQGTTYVSNITIPSSSGGVVGSDSWLAESFRTGTNSGGYTLNSIQLLMNTGSGGGGGFTVLLYGDSLPASGTSLGALAGPADPSAGGLYNYTASELTLSASATYYIVLTATTPVAQGSYSASYWNAPFRISDGWRGSGLVYMSADGLSWSYQRVSLFQYAVNATPVPEPSACALLGLSLSGFGFWRLQQKTAKRAL